MRGDGAESAPAETSAVHVDRELDHIERRNPFPLVTRVRKTRVIQPERTVNLRSGHRRIHRINLHHLIAVWLPQHRTVHTVRLLLDVLEIGRLHGLIALALLKRGEHDIVGTGLRHLGERTHHYGLRNVCDSLNPFTGGKTCSHLEHGLLPHSIHHHVDLRIYHDRRPQTVLPVIIMRISA